MEAQAVVLVGGRGSRLSPLTDYVPKSMIPIEGKPIIHWVIGQLHKHGFNQIILCVNPKNARTFEAFVNAINIDVTMKCSRGPMGLGTAGRVRRAKGVTSSDFLVVYGDVLTDLDFMRFFRFHLDKRALMSIALSAKLPSPFGVAEISSDDRVTQFAEKPHLRHLTSTGIYALNQIVIDRIDEKSDIASDLIPSLIKTRRVYGYVGDFAWLDPGNFRDLDQAPAFVRKYLK